MRRLDDIQRRLRPTWRQFPVRFAYLWGSRARGGRAGARSDWDFAVSMQLDASALDPFLDLGTALARKLGTDEIDLTLLEDADPLVRFLVQHTGRLIYETDAPARRECEHCWRVCYWDEAMRLTRYDTAMAGRIREGKFGS